MSGSMVSQKDTRDSDLDMRCGPWTGSWRCRPGRISIDCPGQASKCRLPVEETLLRHCCTREKRRGPCNQSCLSHPNVSPPAIDWGRS